MARNIRAERVLIIDDDLMTCEVLTLLLEDAGYVVDLAGSGEAALHHLEGTSSPPTILLSDLQMPGLCGAELAAALRARVPLGTPLLAMSGSRAPAAEVEAFDGFLIKPFQPTDLAIAVEDCRLRSLADSLRQGSRNGPAQAQIVPPDAPPGTASASNESMSAHFHTAAQGATHLPGPASPPPALDERIFGQLHQSIPKTQIRQMYLLCLDDVRKRISEMRLLAAGREAEPFVRQAHAIKGGCGMLGASELYRLASDLERVGLNAAGLEGNPGVNPLDELAAACDRLERILGTRT